jgi:hypothetical protein
MKKHARRDRRDPNSSRHKGQLALRPETIRPLTTDSLRMVVPGGGNAGMYPTTTLTTDACASRNCPTSKATNCNG